MSRNKTTVYTKEPDQKLYEVLDSDVYDDEEFYIFKLGGHEIVRRKIGSWVNVSSFAPFVDNTKKFLDDISRIESSHKFDKNHNPARFRGIWVKLKRARKLAEKYGIYDTIAPVLAFERVAKVRYLGVDYYEFFADVNIDTHVRILRDVKSSQVNMKQIFLLFKKLRGSNAKVELLERNFYKVFKSRKMTIRNDRTLCGGFWISYEDALKYVRKHGFLNRLEPILDFKSHPGQAPEYLVDAYQGVQKSYWRATVCDDDFYGFPRSFSGGLAPRSPPAGTQKKLSVNDLVQMKRFRVNTSKSGVSQVHDIKLARRLSDGWVNVSALVHAAGLFRLGELNLGKEDPDLRVANELYYRDMIETYDTESITSPVSKFLNGKWLSGKDARLIYGAVGLSKITSAKPLWSFLNDTSLENDISEEGDSNDESDDDIEAIDENVFAKNARSKAREVANVKDKFFEKGEESSEEENLDLYYESDGITADSTVGSNKNTNKTNQTVKTYIIPDSEDEFKDDAEVIDINEPTNADDDDDSENLTLNRRKRNSNLFLESDEDGDNENDTNYHNTEEGEDEEIEDDKFQNGKKRRPTQKNRGQEPETKRAKIDTELDTSQHQLTGSSFNSSHKQSSHHNDVEVDEDEDDDDDGLFYEKITKRSKRENEIYDELKSFRTRLDQLLISKKPKLIGEVIEKLQSYRALESSSLARSQLNKSLTSVLNTYNAYTKTIKDLRSRWEQESKVEYPTIDGIHPRDYKNSNTSNDNFGSSKTQSPYTRNDPAKYHTPYTTQNEAGFGSSHSTHSAGHRSRHESPRVLNPEIHQTPSSFIPQSLAQRSVAPPNFYSSPNGARSHVPPSQFPHDPQQYNVNYKNPNYLPNRQLPQQQQPPPQPSLLPPLQQQQQPKPYPQYQPQPYPPYQRQNQDYQHQQQQRYPNQPHFPQQQAPQQQSKPNYEATDGRNVGPNWTRGQYYSNDGSYPVMNNRMAPFPQGNIPQQHKPGGLSSQPLPKQQSDLRQFDPREGVHINQGPGRYTGTPYSTQTSLKDGESGSRSQKWTGANSIPVGPKNRGGTFEENGLHSLRIRERRGLAAGVKLNERDDSNARSSINQNFFGSDENDVRAHSNRRPVQTNRKNSINEDNSGHVVKRALSPPNNYVDDGLPIETVSLPVEGLEKRENEDAHTKDEYGRGFQKSKFYDVDKNRDDQENSGSLKLLYKFYNDPRIEKLKKNAHFPINDKRDVLYRKNVILNDGDFLKNLIITLSETESRKVSMEI